MKVRFSSCVLPAILLTTIPPASQAQWIQETTGLSDLWVHALAVNGMTVIAGTNSGAFLSSNNGLTWNHAASGLTNGLVQSFCTSGKTIFAGGGSGVFASTDGGWNWVQAGLSNAFVYTLALDSEYLVASAGSGVFRTTDDGDTWSPPISNFSTFTTFALGGSDLYAGTADGVYLSTDGGEDWAFVGPDSNHNYSAFAVLVTGENLFAGTMSSGQVDFPRIYRSTNTGKTWAVVNSGMPDFGCVDAFAVIGSDLVAGIGISAQSEFGPLSPDGGCVYLSSNDGGSWSEADSGMPPGTFVSSFATMGGTLFAGTNGKGVWTRPLSEMITSAGQNPGQLPGAFNLQQNYPNPFNPSTTIRYALPQRTHVALAVFNTLGQRVATLVDATEEPGEHSVKFDARGLASGVYLYRLQAGAYVKSLKMLSVK